MLTISLFMYLLTSIPTIAAVLNKNYVAFSRVTILPLVFGFYWGISNFEILLTSGFMKQLAFGTLLLPLIAVITGAFSVGFSLLRTDDRESVIRHIVFNKPYTELTV